MPSPPHHGPPFPGLASVPFSSLLLLLATRAGEARGAEPGNMPFQAPAFPTHSPMAAPLADEGGSSAEEQDGEQGDDSGESPAGGEGEEGSEEAGEVVVVTATRTERSWLDSTQATEVVDQDDIRETMPLGVSETLAATPGVSIDNHGGVYYWNPVIRGLSGRRVIMLLDGARIPSDKSMGVTGFFVNTRDVERVEVLRGPGSVMYGSDAIGGVVNILLRDPFAEQGLRGELGATAGSNNRLLAERARLAWSGERLALAASGRRRDAENYVDGDGEEVLNSFFHDNMFSGTVAFRPDRANRLMFRLQGVLVDEVGKAETELDREKHRLIRFPSDDILRANGTWDLTPEPGTLRHLRVSLYEQWTTRDNEVSTFDSSYERLVTQTVKHGDIRDLGGTGYATLSLGGLGLLSTGLDASHKLLYISTTSTMYQPDGSSLEGEEQVEFDGATQGTLGLFAQQELERLGPLSAVLGVRYDTIESREGAASDLSRRDGALSGNLGLNLRTSPVTRITANIGRAFRAPTLEEKFLVTNTCLGTMCGNPELEPESSLNVDLGFKGEPRPARFDVYAFGTWVDNLITAKAGIDAIDESCDYTYTNTARARLLGAEGLLAMDIPLDGQWLHLEPRLTASYVKGDDVLTHEPLPAIPPFFGELSLRLSGRHFPGLLRYFLEPELAFYAAQHNVAPGEEPSDAYALVNATGGLVLNGPGCVEQVELNLAIRNLLDTSYQSHLSLTPGMGRDVRLGASFVF